MIETSKLMVLGLDGATWDLVKIWTDDGKLPTFRKLMKESAFCENCSTMPPITFPAIPSFITGTIPEKHGITDFATPKIDGKLGIVPTGKIKGFIDLIDKKICINLPLTYPANKYKEGIIVSGFLTPSKEKIGFIYPQELKTKLNCDGILSKYQIDNSMLYIPGKEKEFMRNLKDIASQRLALSMYLAQKYKWDFLLTYFTILDRVGHSLWRSDFLFDAYQHVDSILNEFVKIKEKTNSYLILFSDHGFGKSKGRFYANSWLKANNFLYMKNDISRRGLQSFLPIINHIPKKITSFMPKYLADKILSRFREDFSLFFEKLDLEKSDAFASISGIYINHEFGSKKYEIIKNQIVRKLRELEFAKNKLSVKIKLKSEKNSLIPDIIFDIEDFSFEPSPSCEKTKPIIKFSDKDLKGWHRRNGIFLISGPEIKCGLQLNPIEIWDIAPTILHLLDIPIPHNYDGKIVKNAFKKGSNLEKKQIKYQKKTEEDKIKNVIKGVLENMYDRREI